MDRHFGSFVWDTGKEAANIRKHRVDFETAARAFKDPNRKIYTDERHGQAEERLFCFGRVSGKVLTVRFTYRGGLHQNLWGGVLERGEALL